MRVFGCKAFIHVPKNERSKLDNKTKQLFYQVQKIISLAISYEIQKRTILLEEKMLSSLKIKLVKTLNKKKKNIIYYFYSC